MIFAKIFARNYKKYNTWNIRCLVDESFVPATQRIILKIVGFLLEIKPCGLGSRIRDVEAFWYKTKIKIIYFLRLCVIVWFTLTLNFWYVKLKNGLIFFLWLEADFFLIPCYHPKHLQQIHWNKIFCNMYGLGMMLTMKTSKLHLSIQIVV